MCIQKDLNFVRVAFIRVIEISFCGISNCSAQSLAMILFKQATYIILKPKLKVTVLLIPLAIEHTVDNSRLMINLILAIIIILIPSLGGFFLLV